MTIYDPDLGYKLWVWVTALMLAGACIGVATVLVVLWMFG